MTTDSSSDAVVLVIDDTYKRLLSKIGDTNVYKGYVSGLEMSPGSHDIKAVAVKYSTGEIERSDIETITVTDLTYTIPADMVEYLITNNWDSSYGTIPTIKKTYNQKGIDTGLQGNYILLNQSDKERYPHAQMSYVTEVSPVEVVLMVSGNDQDVAEETAYSLWNGVLYALEQAWNNLPDRLWDYLAFENSGVNDSDAYHNMYVFRIKVALVDEWRKVGL